MSFDHKHAVENTEWFAGRVRARGKRPKGEGVTVVAIKTVLETLANHVNDGHDDPKLKNWAWPNRQTLARETSLSPATVDNVILWARYVGFFRHVKQARGENRQWHSTRYLFRDLITLGGTTVTGADGKEHAVGGKVMFKPNEGVEGGWAPDIALKGTIAQPPSDDGYGTADDDETPVVTITIPMVTVTTPCGDGHHTPMVMVTIPYGDGHQRYGDGHQQLLSGNTTSGVPSDGSRSADNSNSSSPPSADAAAAVPSYEPTNTEEPIDGVSETAKRFWEYLGSPARHDPSEWVKPFSELLTRYPNLDDLIHYAFEKEPKRKWKKLLIQADHPVPYLKLVLEPIQSSYERWEEIMQRHAAERESAAAGAARAGEHAKLEDEEDFDSDRPPNSSLEDEVDFG